ncbi:capsular polysaccharide biosythesis protein [Flavobacteria bacterium BAL38]|nr:capsular polysaccharide biosythesis protein [Flavobacteria bacterium BAL38]
MLSLFKSKPKLSELIPSGYVDIHSHVLPGIDDGAKTIEDSDFLIKEMKKLGFTKCITTPHTMKNVWDNTPETIQNALKKIESSLNLPVTLNVGSEYLLDETVVLKAKNKELLTIKDNFVLVELSYLNAPIQLYDYLFEIQLSGYHIILAHPERYRYFHPRKKEFDKLKSAGCLFQLNLLATVGYYGKEIAKTANYLLQENYYDFAGSDIHHKNHIKAFQNKLVINSSDLIQEVMNKNNFFI